MAKGNPNDPSMQLDFIAKVWDNEAQDYKPIYIAPDATDIKRGDVYLSDVFDPETNEVIDSSNADKGVTAATPYAVKKTYEAVANKLDKIDPNDQEINSTILPATDNTQDLGSNNKKWRDIYAIYFRGNLDGNASSATQLQTGHTISIENGTASLATSPAFDGTEDIIINLDQLDASTITTGLLPLNVVPKAALERLKIVNDQIERFALTTDPDTGVQEGDTVYQQDTGIMYLVVDTSELNSEAGYQEYKAGTAAKAMEAEKLSNAYTIQTDLGSNSAVAFNGTKNIEPGVKGILPLGFGGTGVALTASPSLQVNLGSDSADTIFKIDPRPGIYGTLGIGNGGTGLTSNPSMTVDLTSNTAANVFQNTPTPGVSGILGVANGGTGNANGQAASASKLVTSHDFSITGDVVASAVGFNGTGNVTLNTILQDNTVTSAKIVNGTIVSDDLANNSVITAKIADSNVTTAKINNSAVTTAKIADSNVTTAKIAADAVTLAKLGTDVGTVYVGATQPTDNNVIWWIDPTDN